MGGNGTSEGRARIDSLAEAGVEAARLVTESAQHADGPAIMVTKASSANAGAVNAVLSPRFGRRGLFKVQLTRVFSFINIVRF